MNAVAIVGPNGIGGNLLSESIVGQIPFYQGKLALGLMSKVGYYDQT